jgi:hypothetical protein
MCGVVLVVLRAFLLVYIVGTYSAFSVFFVLFPLAYYVFWCDL